MTDEQLREYKRKWAAAYRAKKKAEREAQRATDGQKQPKTDSKGKERVNTQGKANPAQRARKKATGENTLEKWKSEPGTAAALINERYGYTTIIADFHRPTRHVIVERFDGNADVPRVIRVKETKYTFMSSMEELHKWEKSQKTKLRYY